MAAKKPSRKRSPKVTSPDTRRTVRRRTKAGLDGDTSVLAKLRALMEVGLDENAIAVELCVPRSELEELRKTLYASELLQVADRDPSEVFIDYRMRQEQICDELDSVARKAKSGDQFTAAVGALKAKAQILDKVMDRGQSMGVIPKVANRHEVVGGLVLATLTDRELQRGVAETASRTRQLRSVGGVAFAEMDIPGDADIYGTALEVVGEEG